MSVGFECCVLSGTVLCDRPIIHPEETYYGVSHYECCPKVTN